VGASRAIFYPFNANSNPIFVKHRGPRHIFLGHGDSDKTASVNPLIRVYDHVFVSGPAAVDRLTQSGVLTPYDVKTDRVIRIGMPFLRQPTLNSPHRNGAVLYAPTWEGVRSSPPYCSLEGGWGRLLLAQLLETLSGKVVFRAHPSTGRVDGRFARYVKEIVDSFRHHPKFVLHRGQDGGLLGTDSRFGVRCDLSESLEQVNWVITDISSVVTAAAYHGRPFVCVVKDSKDAFGDAISTTVAAAAFRLRHGDPVPAQRMAQLASEEACQHASERLRLSVDKIVNTEPYLRGVPRDRLLDVVLNQVEASREHSVGSSGE
jgi:hypothetical protein